MQRIVQQLASLSHCSFPLLCAPRIAGLLPAPKISGLLTAGSSPVPRSHVRQRLDAWAAADAEIMAFIAGAKSRLSALCAEMSAEVCHV